MTDISLDEVVVAGRTALAEASWPSMADDVIIVDFRDPDTYQRHHQRFERGRFVSWDLSPPDVMSPIVFANRPSDLVEILGGGVDGETAMGMLRVTASSGGPSDRLPPFDRETNRAFETLQPIVGATIKAAIDFEDGPFGPFSSHIHINDGIPAISLGVDTEAEVVVRLRFSRAMQILSTDLPLLEALRGGAVDGEWPKLMLLAGVIESPEFQTALDPSRSAFRYLAPMSELLGSPSYRIAMRTSLGAP